MSSKKQTDYKNSQIYKIYCNDGCFFVECDSRVGIIDNNYKNLVPVKFDTVSKHEIDNLYVVSIDDKYGIFDVQQNFGTDFLFDKISDSLLDNFQNVFIHFVEQYNAFFLFLILC